jgi:hypothetical protein
MADLLSFQRRAAEHGIDVAPPRTRRRKGANIKSCTKRALVFVPFLLLVWAATAAHDVDALPTEKRKTP